MKHPQMVRWKDWIKGPVMYDTYVHKDNSGRLFLVVPSPDHDVYHDMKEIRSTEEDPPEVRFSMKKGKFVLYKEKEWRHPNRSMDAEVVASEIEPRYTNNRPGFEHYNFEIKV